MYKGTTTLIVRAAAHRLAVPGSALVALIIGISVYLFDREWSAVLFLVPFAGLQGERVELFGTLGFVLPAFCHAYAFSLLMILALGHSRHARLIGACSWFVVAAVLEVLQSDLFSAAIDEPTVLTTAAPIFNSLSSYLLSGHFDYGDLVATGLGCALAFLISSVPEKI